MRAVWMPSMDDKFDPDVGGLKQLLPDVVRLEVKLRDLTSHTRFEPDLADTCTFVFANGKELAIDGIYLWKFLDAIPAQLGSDAHGYFDQNPYADEYTEATANRLRQSYRLIFREQSGNTDFRRPAAATIDLVSGKVHKVWRPKLEKPTLEFLAQTLTRAVEGDKSIGQKVGQLVAEETAKPKFELGWVDIGGGRVGRRPQSSPWPDLSVMPYEEFSRLLSTRTRGGGPMHYTQSDLVSEIFDASGEELLLETVTKLRKESRGWFADFAKQLGCTTSAPRTSTVLAALSASDDRFVGSDAVFGVWHRRLKSKTVKQVIALGATKAEAKPAPNVKAPKRFRMVAGLWLAADFTEVEAGRKPAPYINHDAIDFEALQKLLAEAFKYGPPVTIRVANDTIDQVTVHMRGTAQMQCTDFGEALLSKASRTTGDVVEIQQEWSGLHIMKDRTAAPPPIVVLFVVEADDFEDAMMWADQTSPVIGLPLAIQRMMNERAGKQPKEGKLPPVLKRGLEEVFGCPFLDFTVISRPACDPFPKGYRQQEL